MKSDTENAERMYLKVIDIYPDSIPARRGMGQVKLQEKDYEEARRWFLSVLEDAPGDNTAREALNRIDELRETPAPSARTER